ncbi:MAG TPA: hypothetical protein VFI14_01675 [Chryseosolibacter sp.]|nr:hypothetical protein [Chryseosolibacter sp.]
MSPAQWTIATICWNSSNWSATGGSAPEFLSTISYHWIERPYEDLLPEMAELICSVALRLDPQHPPACRNPAWRILTIGHPVGVQQIKD